MTRLSDRASWVWFEELERWNVQSFFETDWAWSKETIKPLTDALKRSSRPVDRSTHAFEELQLVTLRFDGSVEARDLRGKESFKGSLFFADPGDLVFSKIDVRNGAIGIVPKRLGRVAVSSEYPVYRVDETVADRDYLALLLRTDAFKSALNAMISGASGRKRITPEALEEMTVPVPPLPVQEAIVAYWHEAQTRASALQAEAAKAAVAGTVRLLEDLGTPLPEPTGERRRWRVADWSEMDRWSVPYLENARQGCLGFVHSRYAIEPLGEHLVGTMNGLSTKPVGHETGFWTLKLNALTPDGLNLTAVKPAPVSAETAKRFSLVKGDLLICRSVGSFDQVAKCALIEEDDLTILFPDIMIRVRMKPSLLSDYVREIIQSSVGRSFFQANARTAVGMWKIGAEDIRNFPIPVPPLDAQEAIVARVRAARAAVARDRAEAYVTLARAKAEVEAMILGTKTIKELSHA